MARSKLVEILQNHGVRAWTRGGHIYALDLTADEVGTVSERVIELPANFRAIKAFLGY